MWKGLLIILAVCLALLPSTVLADDPVEEVTITVSGWVVGYPGGFTVTYISDYEVELSWTKGEAAENTMIRAAYGRLPESREDGYMVYYGTGEVCSDTAVSLDETAIPVYYRAWSQNANGAWENEGVWGFIEGIGVATIALIILAVGLVGLAIWQKRLLLYLAACIGCLIIAVHFSDISMAYCIPVGILSAYMCFEFVWWFF